MLYEEALNKLIRYCAYQDRCHQEVRTKLLQIKVYGDELEQIMSELVSENYLNEERFARNYARGKFRMKHWGKIKITQGLKAKRISAYSIKKAMLEIDEEGTYEESLRTVIEKYKDQRQDKYNSRELQQKTYEHAISKGYESYLVSEVIKSIFLRK